MKWVTREHPKADRIACPWLIRKYIDPGAKIVEVALSRRLVYNTPREYQARTT